MKEARKIEGSEEDGSISLNKYISSTGICSRREADEIIKAGRVRIDGAVAISGNRVFEGQKVTIDHKPIQQRPPAHYIAFHKPVGIVCTTDPKEPKNIIDYIKYPERLFPIGRLDKDSEGLILLTNDGDIVNKILRAGNDHEKEYIVTVDRPIDQRFADKMAKGVPILGTVTKPCRVQLMGDRKFKIILVQGLNRQIRRMCSFFGVEVVRLERIRIMDIRLEGIAVGKWRALFPKELKNLESKLINAQKTAQSNFSKETKRSPSQKTHSKSSSKGKKSR